MTLTQLAALAAVAFTLTACGNGKSDFPPLDNITAPKASAAAPSPAVSAAQAQKIATCAGESILTYVGRPVSSLPSSGPWSTLRVIHSGDKVTMNYLASRLNAVVDGQGMIVSLYCG